MILNSTEDFLDEVDRVIVNVGANCPFFGAPHYVAIAVDRASSGTARPNLISRRSFGCAFLTQSEVFYALCEDRAQRCVDKRFRVNGRVIAPEQYLTLWRRVLSQSISAGDLKKRCGAQLFGILGGPIARLRGVKSPWSDSPFKSFDDFEHRYATQLEYGPEDSFLLRLDLAASGTARDLYFAERFFFRQEIRQDKRSIARLELDIQAPIVAPDIGLALREGNSHVIQN